MYAEHLALSFGAERIYEDCSFHFETRDKVGIVGVNGAGKSTLFKIFMGMEKLDEGKIILPGLTLGYLPQEIKILPELAEMTVWDYIASARPVEKVQEKLNQEYEKLAKYPDSVTIAERIDRLQEEMESFDLANMDNELIRIVEKMNLSELVDQKMVNLSGGQKSKVAFARVLFQRAGLLLLDEPTNHLDVETKEFVANFLRNYHGMVMMISHDEEFLNTAVNKILFLNKTTHKMQTYKGNYTDFRREYAKEQAEKDRKITEQEREIKRIYEFVERARNAKRSNTALIRQGHVREKMLEKKLSELGTREQNYQKVSLNIAPRKQSGKTPIEVQNLTFHYSNKPELYHGLSFALTRGEKFLIVGENGIGKSTLLKLIVGELTPEAGAVIFSQNTEIAYYAQELEILNEKETIFDNVKSYDYADTEIRAMLANFLFADEDIHKQVAVLSPGEKARVALCKILMKKANLIILDEPTNHFDPETQKIIGENFRDYTGTLIMVSHNPSFVEQIGITRMLILPKREGDSDDNENNYNSRGKQNGQFSGAKIKNYSKELMDYYYYLNSELV